MKFVGVYPCVNPIVVPGQGRHSDLPLQCDQNVGVDPCVNLMEEICGMMKKNAPNRGF